MCTLQLLLPQSWMDRAGLYLSTQPRSVQIRSRKGLVQGHTASQRKKQAGSLAVAAACPVVPTGLAGNTNSLHPLVPHQSNEKEAFFS